MTAEPLKNKQICSNMNNQYFYKSDVRSAVEWLKEKMMREFQAFSTERKEQILGWIDEAFKDVMLPGGGKA